MTTTWADKMKRHEDLSFVQLDEIVLLLAGIVIYLCLDKYLFLFAISAVIWYWLKIRYYERLIVRKKRDIYNIQFDVGGETLAFAEGRTAEERKPMNYDLEQFETRRTFLVDKFVIVNIILAILLGVQS